jgi:hypothetical protein
MNLLCWSVDDGTKKKQTGCTLHPSRRLQVNQKRIAFKYVPLGGFIFWAPSVFLHWLRGYRFSRLDVLGLTVLLPITTGLVLVIDWKRWLKIENRLPAALFALLGIWLFGPLMMSVSGTFSGGGISQPDGWHFILIGTCLFPMFTFIMSTYDGTLGALLLTTALLPFLPKLSFKAGDATLKN